MKELEDNESPERYYAVKDFLEPPGIFDGIVAVLSQELRRKPIRMHLCDSTKGRKALIRQFVEKLEHELVQKKGLKVKDFAEVC